jgi:hypothetical protein
MLNDLRKKETATTTGLDAEKIFENHLISHNFRKYVCNNYMFDNHHVSIFPENILSMKSECIINFRKCEIGTTRSSLKRSRNEYE